MSYAVDTGKVCYSCPHAQHTPMECKETKVRREDQLEMIMWADDIQAPEDIDIGR